MGSDPYCAIE